MKPLRRLLYLLITPPVLLFAASIPSFAQPPKWKVVQCVTKPNSGEKAKATQNGEPFNVNGIALIGNPAEKKFLAVGDTKLAIIQDGDVVKCTFLESIIKPKEKSQFEALSGEIPDSPNKYEYIVLEQDGTAHRIKLDSTANTVTEVDKFQVPGKETLVNADFEGFAFYKPTSGSTIAVWAHRGDHNQPAVLFWGNYEIVNEPKPTANKVTYRINPATVRQMPISIYFLKRIIDAGAVRAISDIKIAADGTVFALAAYDSDNNSGPFSSGLYVAGNFSGGGKDLKFCTTSSYEPIHTFEVRDPAVYRKAEALELLANGEYAIATDDENNGGSLLVGKLP